MPALPTNLCSGGVANVVQTSGTLDDGGWGGIPIGFNFNYFGNSYSSINIGTNGVMQFGAYNSANPGGLGQYSIPGYPNVGSPANSIAVMACDLYLTTSGTIRYWTREGFSPNQRFIVEYLNVPGFTTNGLQTVQAILYETTGVVEVHVLWSNKYRS